MSLAFYDIAAGHFLRGRPLAPPTSYVSAGGEEERRDESKRVKCDTLVSGSLQICLIELQRELFCLKLLNSHCCFLTSGVTGQKV